MDIGANKICAGADCHQSMISQCWVITFLIPALSGSPSQEQEDPEVTGHLTSSCSEDFNNNKMYYNIEVYVEWSPSGSIHYHGLLPRSRKTKNSPVVWLLPVLRASKKMYYNIKVCEVWSPHGSVHYQGLLPRSHWWFDARWHSLYNYAGLAFFSIIKKAKCKMIWSFSSRPLQIYCGGGWPLQTVNTAGLTGGTGLYGV